VSGCGGGVTPEQQQALSKLQQLGARVNYNRTGYEVDFRDTAAGNNDLVHLKNVPKLRSVDLRGTTITDEGLQHLKSIPTLEVIDLSRLKLTKEAVDGLKAEYPNATIKW
jgi:hypothetical protein